ncbi:MAG: PPOX class F420-dependent oxidoreductase [Chloroflexi bacterium]|nr:PPOX class F420-dependent oxidoreductase [Chloroflexota bacterium]
MTVEIPSSRVDLLSWEKKAFAHLALTLKDGSPQVTPVWFDWDGTHIIVNSARGRVKDRVMSKQSKVALAISDPDDPYRYLQIRGRVVEVIEEGARDMIDHLSLKYRGVKYQWYKGETRVTYKILPERVSSNG